MSVWILVLGLGSADGEMARGSAAQAINVYQKVEQCEAAGKQWAAALERLVVGTEVQYTITCVLQDTVLVATGRDPMKI